VKKALTGDDATQTRIAHRPKAVFLFSATPVFRSLPDGKRAVAGAVYVTRSTTPVLVELYRIRSGLLKVLAVALCLSIGTTLLLAFSISRPLTRLSKAAKRIAAGERGVALTVTGSGEIRELSESFKTMTEKLDQRLVYISDFSADVAHEFKSPLTSIRGAAELLAEGAHAEPEARERFLKNILLDSERLDRLVSRLLVLSRIEASAEDMTVVDLRALLDRLAGRARERGPVELSHSSKRSWVRGRESDLETALGNLIENAQRYSPAGRAVRIFCEDSSGGIRVSVCDEGPGIPEARRSKVFERFYTTDADAGGTGLGLAIVDSVALAHGGRITFETEVGTGSRFHLWLPA
jgi:two-component system sensor histidine kinase ChvG